MISRWIDTARKLHELGVVGINARNADFIMPHNPRRLYPLVDDKLLTKEIAQKAGIATPTLYGKIEYAYEVAGLADLLKPYEEFVVKPAQGSGGDGILVVKGRTGSQYKLANGALMNQEDMDYHVNTALAGVFSLGGQPDKVLIEYCVQFDSVFERIAFQGIPDVRIVVFMGVPAMAMVRLPTKSSKGKANLHQGAIGTGVDLSTGKTLTAVSKNEIVEFHPDTNNPVAGVQIPHWQKMMELAARSRELTGLGYQGIDIILDKDQGPLILELNARPGLQIQIANNEGLRHRLEKIQANVARLDTVQSRVAFAMENFPAKTIH